MIPEQVLLFGETVMIDDKRTIAALATPTGKGGIGIIRVSGARALELTIKHFFLPQGRQLETVESHRVYYGFIRDEQGRNLDEVLYLHMKAPRSYTAEDVVEIQSHSSPVVLRAILALLVRNGVEPAEPGEFTKRAYLHGRIDLTQAEAVIDIINARTETSLDIALSHIEGSLKSTILELRERLLGFQARVEAAIDFPDDVGDVLDQDESLDLVRVIRKELTVLRKNHEGLRIFRDGLRMVIVGPPNSGKSSLLNALLNREKAIVTPIPGTTRDLIEDLILIDGIPIEITDTAGIHQTSDLVEQLGIQKTLEKIESSDLIILMLDGSKHPGDSECESLSTVFESCRITKKVLIVANKCDLVSETTHDPRIPEPDIRISVRTRENLDTLKSMIAGLILQDMPENRNSVVPNVRQDILVGEALKSVNRIIEGMERGFGHDLVAMDIQECVGALDQILGLTPGDEVLDRIFSTFCIGK